MKTEGRGRQFEKWKLRAPGLDNHWLDCLVGQAVGASMQGAVLFGTDIRELPRRPRVRPQVCNCRGTVRSMRTVST